MMRLCAALPVAVFVLQALIVSRRSSAEDGWRHALLGAALLWGLSLTGITELLSALGAITPSSLALAWAVLAVAFSLAWLVSRRTEAASLEVASVPRESAALAAVAVTGLVVFGTALGASSGWPNQWDAMVYHLSRVSHWVQNGNVAFHPTHVPRELFNPPWSEYAILHFSALGLDARVGNLVQWCSLLGCLVGVTAITRRLGGSAAMQWTSALVAATIPMGVLQAATTQNDYVTALWLICGVEASLSAASASSRAMRVGTALGLAVLTKGTAWIFGPAMIAFAWPWRRDGLGASVRAAAIAAVIAAGIAGNHYGRNFAWFGNPFGPADLGSATGSGDSLVNERWSGRVVLSNVLRNAALHLGAPVEPWNRGIEHLVVGAHRWLGTDVFDPATTRAYPETRYEVRGPLGDPDRTGNPWHFFLIVVSAGLVLARPDPSAGGARKRIALAVIVSALAFCVVLKWQPWHSRLHLPIFVLGSALVGLAASRTRALAAALIAISLLVALPPLLRNRLAPLVGQRNVFNTTPVEQTFQAFGGPPMPMEAAYLGALDVVGTAGCRDVGLLIGWDDWEQPFWQFFPGGAEGRRIEHVLVPGAPEEEFRPCAIISTLADDGAGVRLGGLRYEQRWSAEMGPSRRVLVLVRSDG